MGTVSFFVLLSLIFVGSFISTVHTQGIECYTCELLLEEAEQYVALNGSIQQIFQALNIVCSDIPVWEGLRSDCTKLMETIATDLPKIAHSIDSDPYSPYAVCAMVSLCTIPCCITENNPEQIHLSFSNDPSEMIVTWATSATSSNKQSLIYYGSGSSKNTTILVPATTFTYTSGGWLGNLHRGTISNLTPSTEYFYTVGNVLAMSETYSFTTRSTSLTQKINVLVIADMGTEDRSNATVDNMIKKVDAVDFILHVGDMSYADGYQHRWDEFLRKIQPIAANLAYMTVPGNHELPYNFTSWQNRFPTQLYYSFDYNEIHFVGIFTESELDVPSVSTEQVQWIKNDLANRKSTTKWTIVYGHRPLYCSNKDTNCGDFAEFLRTRIEDILYDYKVDLVIAGHIHDYERSLPVYKNKVVASDYVNPQAPVYIVNGCAGNREGLQAGWAEPYLPWSAVRLSVFGYGMLQVNTTHLQWSFIDETDTALDSFVISKTSNF